MAARASSFASTMLALGDSYTIGEGVPAESAWPAQLVWRLRAEGWQTSDVETLATTGWTTDELLGATGQYEFHPPYTLVSLLIGVNNQYRGRGLDNYALEFSRLLDLAIELAGGMASQVITVSIPDWGVTRFAREKGFDASVVGAEIDRFNACASEQVALRGAQWVDITGTSRGIARILLAEDGLHPSADQYALWVDAIQPVASRILDQISRDP